MEIEILLVANGSKEEYFIKVTAFNEVKEYHGQGTYPVDYVQFKSYLERLK